MSGILHPPNCWFFVKTLSQKIKCNSPPSFYTGIILLYDPWIQSISWHKNYSFIVTVHRLEPCSASCQEVHHTIALMYHACLYSSRASAIYSKLRYYDLTSDPQAGWWWPDQRQFSFVSACCYSDSGSARLSRQPGA